MLTYRLNGEKVKEVMRTIKHEELKGGYSMGRKIIIDACEIFDGEFEVMAMYANGEEIEVTTPATEADAIKDFNNMIMKYAEPLQKALYNKLIPGEKYTLVYMNDFGFPVVEKIKFHSMRCTTYAQYSDVIQMTFTPYKKRRTHTRNFYNCSLMVFEGWQDMKENSVMETVEDENVKIVKSKYSCFDARYIDDMENIFKNPVMIHKDYKVGVNGKVYA